MMATKRDAAKRSAKREGRFWLVALTLAGIYLLAYSCAT